MANQSSGILLLNNTEIAESLGLDDYIRVVEEAFKSLAEGRALQTGLLHVDTRDGDFHLKTGGLQLPKAYFGLKVNGRFLHNQERHGLRNVQGIIYLADGETGTPVALMDSMHITINRTGATTAMAAKYLARPDASVITVCGCGKQGRIHLAALARVRPIKKAFAHGRNPNLVRAFCEEMSRELGIVVLPAPDLNIATKQSDMVVTCTSSKQFFLRRTDICPGTFVAAIGADSATKQEIEPDLFVGNKIVVDILSQTASVGELHHAIGQGLVSEKDVHAEIGQIIAGKRSGRTSSEEIVIFNSTGTALQDVAVAAAIYQKAMEVGRGIRVDLQK